MQLYSDTPYWLMKNGLVNVYPSVQKNYSCEVVVMGAGISGALMGYHLMEAGFDIMIVDRRHVAMGSTATSTALLQYEIDEPFTRLAAKAGEKNALRSYQLCMESIEKMEKISTRIKHGSFTNKMSFQFASYKKDIADLFDEYNLRLKHNFPVEWLTQKEINNKFNISSH